MNQLPDATAEVPDDMVIPDVEIPKHPERNSKRKRGLHYDKYFSVYVGNALLGGLAPVYELA
jgi:hypothetical protein